MDMDTKEYHQKLERELEPYLVEHMAFGSSSTYKVKGKFVKVNPKDVSQLENVASQLGVGVREKVVCR